VISLNNKRGRCTPLPTSVRDAATEKERGRRRDWLAEAKKKEKGKGFSRSSAERGRISRKGGPEKGERVGRSSCGQRGGQRGKRKKNVSRPRTKKKVLKYPRKKGRGAAVLGKGEEKFGGTQEGRDSII